MVLVKFVWQNKTFQSSEDLKNIPKESQELLLSIISDIKYKSGIKVPYWIKSIGYIIFPLGIGAVLLIINFLGFNLLFLFTYIFIWILIMIASMWLPYLYFGCNQTGYQNVRKYFLLNKDKYIEKLRDHNLGIRFNLHIKKNNYRGINIRKSSNEVSNYSLLGSIDFYKLDDIFENHPFIMDDLKSIPSPRPLFTVEDQPNKEEQEEKRISRWKKYENQIKKVGFLFKQKNNDSSKDFKPNQSREANSDDNRWIRTNKPYNNLFKKKSKDREFSCNGSSRYGVNSNDGIVGTTNSNGDVNYYGNYNDKRWTIKEESDEVSKEEMSSSIINPEVAQKNICKNIDDKNHKYGGSYEIEEDSNSNIKLKSLYHRPKSECGMSIPKKEKADAYKLDFVIINRINDNLEKRKAKSR